MSKAGIIENLKSYITSKNIVLFTILYLFAFVAYWYNPKGVNNLICDVPFTKALRDLFGAISYALIFLKLYHLKPSMFKIFEPYGKLGLTNYSFMGNLGILLSLTIIIPLHVSMEYAIWFYVMLFVFQLVFSNIWLKYFQFGPYEWLWRCLTSMKFTSPVKRKE
ncbi:MAG: DUF418 domain-containing protein [Bacteroides sp.]|nr:DUF418 domain-containing protein [Bacteroides sp.]MCM1447842.1 DUF418 domain-containing protein [Bacteroides sp.]